MAIRGIGTEEDPFLFSSYEEMKEICSYSGYANKFAKLTCNIDCNNYGASWEWRGFPNYCIIDLDSHIIENIVIAANSYIVNMKNNSQIKNGALLNIFGNSFQSIIRTESSLDKAIIRGVQFNMNLNSILDYAFINTAFEDCSFYIFANKLTKSIFSFGSDNTVYTNIETAFVKGCDLWFDINNCNKKNISEDINYDRCGFDLCRFQGIIRSGIRPPYLLTSKGLMRIGVWNVDTTGTTTIGGDYLLSEDRLTYSTSTGVINNDLSPFYTSCGADIADSDQMKNYIYLNSVGFTVIKKQDEGRDENG